MNHPASSQQGMTLLEILVVLVITATLASLIVLNFSTRAEDQLQRDAERFAALLEQHCQDAMLLGQIRGLSLDDRGYQFWYRANKQWLDAGNGKRVYRSREWAGDWDLELSINGLAESLNRGLDSAEQQPRLICLGDGLLPLFVLRMGSLQRNIPGLRLISGGSKAILIDKTL